MNKFYFFFYSIFISTLFFLAPSFVNAFEESPTLWIQVPQWKNDWSECAVDVPDSSCHWYVAAPDSTFGEGFSWENSPWFDANGLSDVPSISIETAVQKLQHEN